MSAPRLTVIDGAQPEIVASADLAEMTRAAVAALRAPGGVYVRGRQLVRVLREPTPETSGGITRPAGAPLIDVLSLDALRGALARVSVWRARGTGSDGARRRIEPPMTMVRDLASRGEWSLPVLTGVVTQPTMRPGGTVIEVAGYDAESGLYVALDRHYPRVPERPSADDVRRALDLLAEPLAEVCWVDAVADRAAVLAAVLALVARHAIDGPVPLSLIRATTPGAGKGLLVDVIATIGTGRGPHLMVPTRDEAELDKRILALGMEGAQCVSLDNIEGALGSTTLAAALTAWPTYTSRVLGISGMRAVPVPVWLATGNGVSCRGDLGRRVIPIDLDPQCERPEARTFRRPDLRGWVREHQPELLSAALTVLRAYVVAGRPPHRRGAPMGSYEAWDTYVRGAVVWSGWGDPCAGRERIREEGDQDLDVLRDLLAALRARYGSDGATVGQMVQAAATDEGLRTSLSALHPRGEMPSASLIGDRLRRARGRIVDGQAVEMDPAVARPRRWRVVRLSA